MSLPRANPTWSVTLGKKSDEAEASKDFQRTGGEA